VFLSAELNADLSSLRYHAYFNDIENAQASRAEYTISQSYGFSLLPGYFINDRTAIYARFGG